MPDLIELAALIFGAGFVLVAFAIFAGASAIRELADAIRSLIRSGREW